MNRAVDIMTSVAQQRVALLTNTFGFDPRETQHHFLVSIPRGAAGKIEISEHFSWDETRGSGDVSYSTRADGQIRIMLPRLKWDAIADQVRAEFNIRLRRVNIKPGGWKAGPNPVTTLTPVPEYFQRASDGPLFAGLPEQPEDETETGDLRD
jgi:uncharacterized protein DUF3780